MSAVHKLYLREYKNEAMLCAMNGYGQFCPVALAAEVFAERWTPLILRELLSGARRFADILRGVPRIEIDSESRIEEAHVNLWPVEDEPETPLRCLPKLKKNYGPVIRQIFLPHMGAAPVNAEGKFAGSPDRSFFSISGDTEAALLARPQPARG